MSRYNIHIDPNLPDSDSVKGHQDFDALFKEYRAVKRFDFWRNLYKDPKVFAGLAAAFAIIFLVFQAVDDTEVETAYQRMGAPVAAELMPEQVWTLSGDQDTTLYLTERLSLFIPAGALIDSSGKTISEAYELSFRQMDQLAEQFISGTDGAGQPFSLDATSQGNPLQIGEGVELFVRNDHASVIHYSEDVWLALAEIPGQETGAIASVQRPELPAILRNNSEAGRKALGPAPQRPGKPFGVKVRNINDFPQFRGYENVYWEYIPFQGHADPWADGLINDTLSQVRIRPYRDDTYELLFTSPTSAGGITRKIVVARPFLSAQNEAVALSMYQDRMEEYSAELSAWEAEKEQIRAEEAQLADARMQYQKAMDLWLESQTTPDTAAIIPHSRYPIKQFGYLGFAPEQLNASDSLQVTLFLATENAPEAEDLVRVFIANPDDGVIFRGVQEKEDWKLPNTGAGSVIWAYGHKHIWIGKVMDTKEKAQEVTLTLLPDHLETTEDIIRHLAGVL